MASWPSPMPGPPSMIVRSIPVSPKRAGVLVLAHLPAGADELVEGLRARPRPASPSGPRTGSGSRSGRWCRATRPRGSSRSPARWRRHRRRPTRRGEQGEGEHGRRRPQPTVRDHLTVSCPSCCAASCRSPGRSAPDLARLVPGAEQAVPQPGEEHVDADAEGRAPHECGVHRRVLELGAVADDELAEPVLAARKNSSPTMAPTTDRPAEMRRPAKGGRGVGQGELAQGRGQLAFCRRNRSTMSWSTRPQAQQQRRRDREEGDDHADHRLGPGAEAERHLQQRHDPRIGTLWRATRNG